MKHIIYTVIITLLLVQIMAMKQSNEQPASIYNRISNKILIKAIGEFVEKHKGTKIDKESKFLKLYIRKRKDNYDITVSHMNDMSHNTFNHSPVIICSPIAGKKIYIDYYGLNNLFIFPNAPEMALYFKEDCPQAYSDYIEEYNEHKSMIDYIVSPWVSHNPTLELKFDYSGNLIDSTYCELI